MTAFRGAGPADRPPLRDRGWGAGIKPATWGGGGVLSRFRTDVAIHSARLRNGETEHVTRAQLVLAPLCIVAAGAAFFAEVIRGSDDTTFSALSVIPVLAASLLRSRPLTLIVASFAMLLQVWGIELHVVNREAAGMQISVYMLTLAIALLQQSRSPLALLERRHPAEAAQPIASQVAADPAPVLEVAGHAPAPVDPGAAPLPSSLSGTLTRREREVVHLSAKGLTAREVGSLLFIGERTVESHLAHAYAKLGIRTKLELVRLVAAHAERAAEFRTGTDAANAVNA